MDGQQGFELLARDASAIFSEEGLREKLTSGKKLTVKFGADPSRPDLHLGHTVPLRKLRLLQRLGHEIVFVIGDFTGMIGDPSGRSKTRAPLSFEETRRNGQSYFEQVTKILDPALTRITYNSEWLAELRFEDVLRLAGKYTLARILERDDFANRYAAKQPIGLHELFYPLMQGYDSVALHADIEVGGTDQTFNLLVGRELQRDYDQPPQEVIVIPIIPGLDGVEKMSKSLDNYIGIDEPADSMFEKCMRVPDALMSDYFRLTTDVDESVFASCIARDVREAHFLYAREIVRMYCGDAAAGEAEQRYRSVASGGAPEKMDVLEVSQTEASVLELLVRAGFASSNSDARRLVQGRGVKLDGQVVTQIDAVLRADAVLSKGKNRFVQVRFCSSQCTVHSAQ